VEGANWLDRCLVVRERWLLVGPYSSMTTFTSPVSVLPLTTPTLT